MSSLHLFEVNTLHRQALKLLFDKRTDGLLHECWRKEEKRCFYAAHLPCRIIKWAGHCGCGMEILPKFSGSISVFEENKSKVFSFTGGKKKLIHVIFFQQKALLFSSDVLKGRALSILSHASVKKQLCNQLQLLTCSGFIGIIVLINTELCQEVTR